MNLKQAHPDEPWLWRPDWASGEIHSSAQPGAIAICVIALIWNAIALPGAVPTLLAHNLSYEPKFAWLALFPIVGLGLIAWAIHLLLRWNAYGDSRFEMKSVPGKIGGTLEGYIHVGSGIEPMRRVTLKLVCINHTSSGNSGSDRPLWSDESEVTAGGDGSIPVVFLIPQECRPTDDSDLRDRIYWRLKAQSAGGIVNYKSSFEVPIFQIGETSAQAAELIDLRARREQRVSEFRPQGSAIRFGLTADGQSEIYFRPFRNPSVTFALLGFFAIWSGTTYEILREHAPLIFRIMWPAFEAIIGLWLIVMMFGSTTVQIGDGLLKVTWRVGGIPVRTRRVPSSEARDVRSITGMTAGTRVYRRIQLRYGQLGELNFGDGIADPIEADWLATRIGEALGLTHSSAEKTVA
ncbi:hypothetical protein [Candidatus Binatus sp.]|uniref:hypothetical protein n=1 Tax=Candidatus Binatus sp. TaxID=2811406 RepID=UPI003BAF4213